VTLTTKLPIEKVISTVRGRLLVGMGDLV